MKVIPGIKIENPSPAAGAGDSSGQKRKAVDPPIDLNPNKKAKNIQKQLQATKQKVDDYKKLLKAEKQNVNDLKESFGVSPYTGKLSVYRRTPLGQTIFYQCDGHFCLRNFCLRSVIQNNSQ